MVSKGFGWTHFKSHPHNVFENTWVFNFRQWSRKGGVRKSKSKQSNGIFSYEIASGKAFFQNKVGLENAWYMWSMISVFMVTALFRRPRCKVHLGFGMGTRWKRMQGGGKDTLGLGKLMNSVKQKIGYWKWHAPDDAKNMFWPGCSVFGRAEYP